MERKNRIKDISEKYGYPYQIVYEDKKYLQQCTIKDIEYLCWLFIDYIEYGKFIEIFSPELCKNIIPLLSREDKYKVIRVIKKSFKTTCRYIYLVGYLDFKDIYNNEWLMIRLAEFYNGTGLKPIPGDLDYYVHLVRWEIARIGREAGIKEDDTLEEYNAKINLYKRK